MLRTITISLLILVSVGAMLPLADSTAHGIRQNVSYNRHRHYRRHSRAWWRRYHARMRRRRAAALAAHRNVPLSPTLPRTSSITGIALPPIPSGWSNEGTINGAALRFRASNDGANMPGKVSLSVVALSRPNPAYLTVREQSRMLAGINISDLRRIVIDKMITAGGWVTNDFVRDVKGERVFVVTAQTPGDVRAPEKSWSFYFTEVNGRVYSLTTDTPVQFSERMATEAERFIDSLHGNPASQPTNR